MRVGAARREALIRRCWNGARMIVNPHRRAASARLLLDAVTSLDIDDSGTEDADDRLLLALQPLGLDLPSEPKAAAALAAAVDLLALLTMRLAPHEGASPEELVSNMRQHVLPRAYPEAYEQR